MDDFDTISDLPPGAVNESQDPPEINDRWLEHASEDLQRCAMSVWFHSRYCDPAVSTPYNGREGGYLFIHGGPYDPGEVLPERFSGIVDDEVINSLVEDLWSEVGDEWAPSENIYFDEEYFDPFLSLDISERRQPYNNLLFRVGELRSLVGNSDFGEAGPVVRRMVFSSVISALESYLWEVVSFWVDRQEGVVENIVTRHPHFKDQTIKLKDIYKEHEGLKEKVSGYLQNLVWHRWKHVAAIIRIGLNVDPPSFKVFADAVKKRHNIVHRSGHDKTGNPVSITDGEIIELCEMVLSFAEEMESKLDARFP
ncbi:MAG: hypothetical protein ACQEXC_09660 [Pseudomonadota bacterium]